MIKKSIAAILIALCLSACAKQVIIPPPPEVTKAIEAIAVSNMPAEQKAAAMQQLYLHLQEQYRLELARAQQAGANIKDVVIQVLAFGAAIATLTLQAVK